MFSLEGMVFALTLYLLSEKKEFLHFIWRLCKAYFLLLGFNILPTWQNLVRHVQEGCAVCVNFVLTLIILKGILLVVACGVAL